MLDVDTTTTAFIAVLIAPFTKLPGFSGTKLAQLPGFQCQLLTPIPTPTRTFTAIFVLEGALANAGG